MTSTTEIQKDVEELQRLVETATRSRVQDLLRLEIRRLQTELIKQDKAKPADGDQQAPAKMASRACSAAPQVYKELIKSYAWDQSDKFMKLYVTLKGVQSLDKTAIASEFTQQSVKVEVKGLNGKNSELCITRLAEQIDPDASYHKVKPDMVLVMLKKKATGKTWAYVTEQEKKSKEMKKPNLSKDDDSDPSAGLMSMLKNMYEDGDDEMKRTLSKAFYESQNKKAGEFGDMGV
ncbi:calcyclin-binding protein-like [Babylonia areolata]|uniref:calcyclin-binding protein-like n=1 Tax=Babylonia areolata TaxID=304850 RepID=UPI003FD0D71F